LNDILTVFIVVS